MSSVASDKNINFTPLFYLMNENYNVIEVKLNDMPKETALDQVYHWLFITKKTNKIEKLIFKSMSEEVINGNKMNVREFDNAELRFDEAFAKFQLEGEGHILMNSPVTEITIEGNELILDFLRRR
jgi:hypothetical protein